MRKQIELNCDFCNKLYSKDLSEFRRNTLLKNRKNFCSLSCTAKWSNKNVKRDRTNMYDISKHSNNGKDEYSPFRYMMKCTKNKRGSLKEHTITLENLKQQFELQNGICPYTKIKLHLPKTTSAEEIKSEGIPFYEKASLDRIDSSKGYVEGNIEFVSMAINFLKNKYSKEEVFTFLDIIKEQDAKSGY